MEKRNYNPLTEGYSVKTSTTVTMDGYSAKKGYTPNNSSNAPQEISYTIQSGVSKPSSHSNITEQK
ncbi:MAG: hypothetical protein ACQERK_05250 [Campylobacterota bacterium]